MPTLSGRADPGRSDDVQTEIPLLGDVGLARVQAHPNEDGGILRPLVHGVRTLHLRGGGDGLARPREGEEERITLRVESSMSVNTKVTVPLGSEGIPAW